MSGRTKGTRAGPPDRVRGATRASRALAMALPLVGCAVPAVTTEAERPDRGVVAPRFVEETAADGIDHRYDGEWEFFVGGGVAVFDCDADGRPDLYVAGGTEPASLYRNRSAVGGALAFTRAEHPGTDLTLVTGAYPIDIDGDDVVDLAVLRRGENVLLRGRGDCAFERANEAWGFDGGDGWTTAFSAKWEPGATLPTLALGNYLVITDDRGARPRCDESLLFRPEADGGRYAQATPLTPGYCTLSMLFTDWDRTGRRDLRVSNDRHYAPDGEEQLWRVEPGRAPRPWTRDEGWRRLRIWGMGIASQDIDDDGYPELYLTSMGDNKLRTLTDGPAQPSYGDTALKRGVTAHRPFTGGELKSSTGWHAEFDDVNNDGRIDLFVAKGNVDAMPDFAGRDPNNLFLGKRDGAFEEAAEVSGVLDFARSRGAAVSDLNLDGLLDLVVVERREALRTWRNVGRGEAGKPAPMGNWLAVELAQDGPNIDAVGAWIEVGSAGRTIAREVTIGGGHAGGQLGPSHFGLGLAKDARIRVHWPDGERSAWLDTRVNRRVRIERGHGEPVTLEPPGG